MLVCIFIARPRATIAASSGLRSDLVHTDEEAIKEGGGLSGGGGGPTNVIFDKYSLLRHSRKSSEVSGG